MKKLFALFLIAISSFWILNLSFGIVEPPPFNDNMPLTGNLDEGLAGALVLYGMQLLMGKKK